MKKNGLLKYSLIIIFIFIGLLFTSTICYAAGDNSNNNIPYCNYKYSGDLDGKDFSYDITIGYYQNKLGFYNQKTKKITDSLQVKGLYTVSISSDSKSALKASGTSFTCPSNVNMIFTSVDIMATTFKKSFNLTKDNSIIKAVDDGKNQNGNKLEKCSNEHLSQMKNELTSVYETYLYNPVKIKINEIDSLERYNNQDSNMNKTDISYLENMGQSTINFYNSILKGAYATKKKEVIQKYRESCTFDNNNSTLKSIQQKEEELASTIRTKLMNKRNIVKGWMQETGVDEATINQQNEQFNRNILNSVDKMTDTIDDVNDKVKNEINKINDDQELVVANCGMFSDIMPYLKKVFTWIRILVPVALIVFGFVDFTTPVISNDKDALSKATSRFIKRCIIGVIIFFVPTILNLLLGIYNDATGANATTCGLGKILINFWR